MNGGEPTFRWDAYGLTAYYFKTGINQSYINGIDTCKGVRFDRLGIYGFDGKDGASWHPKAIEATVLDEDENQILDSDCLKANASFYLTWDGLRIIPNNLKYDETIDDNIYGINRIYKGKLSSTENLPTQS
jgi:hypothetical protein